MNSDARRPVRERNASLFYQPWPNSLNPLSRAKIGSENLIDVLSKAFEVGTFIDPDELTEIISVSDFAATAMAIFRAFATPLTPIG